ncbi:MAG: tetratricopeptide repeat protein [Terracidiphilus sp.]
MLRMSLSSSTLLIAGGLLLAQAQPANRSNSSVAQIEALIRSRQYDLALQVTRSSLGETPGDFRLWTLEGIVFSLKGSSPDALAAFDRALRLSPSYVPALKGEVQLFYEGGDKRAVPLLERILKADPGDQTAHEMLAMLEKRQGACPAAIAQFLLSTDVIETHPDSLEAYGYCLAQTHQLEKAIDVFEQLIALRSDRTYPKYDLAVILVETKQNVAALKVLDPLLTSDQQDPDILSLASQADEAVGDTPKAVSLLRQAIVLSPTTADYYVAFAALCLDHDSFQVGIDMIDAGLQRIPNDPSLYLSRGLLYAQLAQYDNADADFTKAEQLDSTGSLSFYAVDLTELEKNNPDQALARVRSQLKSHPDSPLLNLLLARLLMNQAPAPESASYREAMKAVLLALKLKPDLAKARDVLASMYMRSGQYGPAVEQCRLALQYDPSDETAMYHLIIALRHSGHNDELQPLVKRLSEMHQESMQQETGRKRFKLVEGEPQPPKQ